MAKVLLIDDDRSTLRIYKRMLKDFDTTLASSGVQAIKLIDAGEQFDVIVSDFKMPNINGVEVLEFIKRQPYRSEVILVTGHATVESAIKVMKLGAFDYLIKPVDKEELRAAVEKSLETARMKNGASLSRDKLNAGAKFGALVRESEAMIQVSRLLEKAASASDLDLLITGDAGTGKELVARIIHEKSDRRHRPFVVANCGLLSSESWRRDLFGDVGSAQDVELAPAEGYFQKAGNGTLFLDEVSLLPVETQVALLGALGRPGESLAGTGGCRVIAVTSQDLPHLIEKGEFRKDLFYRLNALPIELPPLRKRPEDIQPLAYCFLDMSGMRSKIQRISDEALACLKSYDWPGNARELRNCIETAASFCGGPEIEVDDLRLSNHSSKPSRGENDELLDSSDLTYNQALEIGRDQAARKYLSRLIETTLGNVSKAAKIAGIERASLHRILKRYQIDPRKQRLPHQDKRG